jgi:DNA-binding CsgD family transcriptional regulator
VWQLGSRARLKLMEGRWSEALLDAETVLTEPSASLARTWPLLIRGLVTLRRGGDASSDLDAAWVLARSYDEPMRTLPAAAALAEQAWLTGRPDARLDECRALLRHRSQPGLGWARGDLAVWMRRLDPDVEIDDVEDLAPPHRRHLAGDALGAAGEWNTLSAPYDHALSLIDAGGDDATRLGLDVLDRLGAAEIAAKVRLDLRRSGATAVPARRRGTTLANPAGLTNRQIDILRLLVDRSTNAEIAQKLYLSPKTVDHHVSALLSKLQVSSRHDAVRRARELGIDIASASPTTEPADGRERPG